LTFVFVVLFAWCSGCAYCDVKILHWVQVKSTAGVWHPCRRCRHLRDLGEVGPDSSHRTVSSSVPWSEGMFC